MKSMRSQISGEIYTKLDRQVFDQIIHVIRNKVSFKVQYKVYDRVCSTMNKQIRIGINKWISI